MIDTKIELNEKVDIKISWDKGLDEYELMFEGKYSQVVIDCLSKEELQALKVKIDEKLVDEK